jgi:hypothetical protein
VNRLIVHLTWEEESHLNHVLNILAQGFDNFPGLGIAKMHLFALTCVQETNDSLGNIRVAKTMEVVLTVIQKALPQSKELARTCGSWVTSRQKSFPRAQQWSKRHQADVNAILASIPPPPPQPKIN